MTASNTHSHDYYEDLLGAYALDAVSNEERAEMERHLATCDTCPAELAQFRATVADLAFLADDIEPPASLRERIRQDAINAQGHEPAPLHSIPAPAPIPASATSPISLASVRERLLPWSLAAVFLLATLGMLAWNIQLQQRTPERVVETIVLRPANDPAGNSGIAHYIPDERVLVLMAEDLPALAPGQIYQVWLIDGEAPIPAGVLHAEGERVAIAADRAQFQAVAITIEPGPLGSPLPTSDPFIVTPLQTD